ncbi:RDD family protein [Nocardioides bizhenqiangii]|uniref:RDD family protein n=1 Tax=Nocardioides bizhenqiangii TaxID=3095076 RepID=A0ABZ0ZVJ8_9ACTN|nr:RDD family protein [Nocardioides sp. HM61]WQQ27263.1 RDD family protein [Nocardioides sp. HM61]
MASAEGPGLIGRMAGAVTGRVVDAVPPEVILDHLDLDAFLDRIDINHLLDRIDVDRLLARVDLNALLSDVQLAELVRRAGIPELVAETSGQLAGGVLDSARRQLVGVDTLLERIFIRAMRRRPPDPVAPAVVPGSRSSHREQVSGRFAGAASRAVAAGVDLGVILLSYSALVGLTEFVGQALFDVSVRGASGLVAAIALGAWAVVYIVTATTITGRTVGKALVGLKIVSRDTSPLRPGAAALRALTFPFSTALLGLGLLPILTSSRHRALHDVLAGTVVVYDWGDRPAELPAPLTAYLRRRNVA